ncbi:MAG: hypothetical protein H0V00_09420, partial [Chloroflexia bacterium]|nr:hypothetical protein [Chloroflexia bacterium]
MLGIPRDLEEAAAIIAEGAVRVIDVGEAKGQIFFEGGSVGLNAAVFREAQGVDGDAGRYRALWSALRTLVRYRPPRMVIHLDDRVLTTRALAVSVANGPYSGLGFTVSPGAQIDDGLLDVVIYSRFSRTELIRHLPPSPSAAVVSLPRPRPIIRRGCASRACTRCPAGPMPTTWVPPRWSTWCGQEPCG